MSAPTEVTPPGAPPVAYSDPSTSALATIRAAIGQGGMLVALLIVVVFFQITTNGVMLKSLNVTNVFLQNGYILVMALGMLLVIVIGHIDLSVGSVAGFLGAIVAVLLVGVEVPVLGEVQLDPILAVAVTLIAGGLIGVFQGAWIAYLRVPSFIVTLAGMLLFRGATLFMLGGQPVGPFPESFRAISSGFIPELIGTVADPFGTGKPPLAIGPLVLPLGGDPLNLTTLLVGAILSGFVVFLGWRSRREQVKYGFAVPSMAQFWLRNVGIILGIMFIAYRLAGYKGLPIVALISFILIGVYMFLTLKTTHRTPDLRGRWQRQGGDAVGRQREVDGLPHVHQHGRAGGPRRHDHRRPLQLRHPQGRLRLRAGRHRGHLRRRRIRVRRRRARWPAPSSAPSSSASSTSAWA